MVFPLYHLPMNPFYREVAHPGITYQGLSWGYRSPYPSVGELTSCISTVAKEIGLFTESQGWKDSSTIRNACCFCILQRIKVWIPAPTLNNS